MYEKPPVIDSNVVCYDWRRWVDRFESCGAGATVQGVDGMDVDNVGDNGDLIEWGALSVSKG